MNVLSNAIRSKFRLGVLKPIQSQSSAFLALLIRDSPRQFSAGSEQPPPAEGNEPFINDDDGVVYGKLTTGFHSDTWKSDIIHLLDGCRLTPDDIKVRYSRSYKPLDVWLQFQSRRDFGVANTLIRRKGGLYKLERGDRSQWDELMPYNEKAVLLEGIPRNAIFEDLERFLHGCEYDASATQLLSLPGSIDRIALVRFPTRIHATNAVMMKNRGFILNKHISMRVLQ